jgi:hypothetical protein
MSRSALQVTAAALVVLCGCAGTSGAVLRVRPPPPGPDGSAEAQRLGVEQAVRDVADMGRLTCAPPKEPSSEIVGCWPGDLGASPAFVSLHLRTAQDGYEVSILESFGPASRPRALCSIQDRLTERLELRLGGGVVERDPRVTCARKGL